MTHCKNQDTLVVTAQQMQSIEAEIFAMGMPVASLMEKVALSLTEKIIGIYPRSRFTQVGIIAGCGHNGGDSLVVARELCYRGYDVVIFAPMADKSKDLTAQHLQYGEKIGIDLVDDIEKLSNCNVIIDGLFGIGLTREIKGNLAEMIEIINNWQKPIVSIDLPSGIHTDTGEVLGTAVKASQTFCLGLWKQGLFQESALEYLGKTERVDFGIPQNVIEKVLGEEENHLELVSPEMVRSCLPLPRRVNTYKYKQGHLLLVCGSQAYAGATLLSAYGAIASGVGMLSVAVPASLKPLINAQIPSALAIPCPETEQGAIASLPSIDFSKYQTIVCGMGLTTATKEIINSIIPVNCPVIFDADALNIIANNQYLFTLLRQRIKPTVITPHQGEFNRLFPDLCLSSQQADRISIVKQASESSKSIILLKGARTIISNQEQTYIVAESTPALARGGSGDVLSGFLGGLVAQHQLIDQPSTKVVATGAWLHQQAGILASRDHSEMGVDSKILSQYLTQAVTYSHADTRYRRGLPILTN